MNRQRLRNDAAATALYLACMVGFYALSRFLLSFDQSMAPLWPATGLVLATLLLSPRDRWGYWIGLTLLAHVIHAAIIGSAPWRVNLQTTLIAVGQVVAQAWLITRWLKRPIRFERLPDVFVLLLVVGVGNLLTTPLAALAVSAVRSDDLMVYMRTRWLSHTLTAMTLTPFLVTWGAALYERVNWTWRQVAAWSALILGTWGIVWLAILPAGRLAPFLPAPYLCLLPLATAAILFRSRGATLITVIIMLHVMVAVGRGGVWPEGGELVTRLARAQLFLGFISATGLLLGTSIGESDARARQWRESEERYRTAMHNSAIGMAIVSLTGRWLEVNPKLCEITGYSRSEMLQLDSESLTYAEDREAPAAKWRDLAAGVTTTTESVKRYVHRSGRLVWVHLTATLVRDDHGRALHFVTQTQDITARKEAEAKLVAAAERLALALRTSRLGVWRHDLAARTLEWDYRMFEIFGLAPGAEVLTEEQMLHAIIPEDRDGLEQAWAGSSSSGGGYRIACQVRWPDGQFRHVELQGIVEQDHSTQVSGVANDTTEIVRATAESESLKAQLQQAQKMEALGNLAAGVAHDFNTLLSGINVFVDMASTTLAPSHEASSLLHQARRGASSARALVRRILNYSRGSRQVTMVACNLVELVRDTAPLLAASLPANVSLALEMQGEDARVRADPAQLQQILINLSTNAAQAIGDQPGRVDIRVGLSPREAGLGRESHVCLVVTDDGCGMNDQTRARIFDPYFTTKKDGAGTGLGLAIVRDIVVAHGGELDVISVEGKGTTVSVCLPLLPRVAGSRSPIPERVGRS